MKIQHVKISNILGIKDLEFDPATGFNEIVGKNGEGKTSVIESIKEAIKGGHDATLLRKGEEKGEIVLVLDDEQTSIRRRVSASGSTTDLLRDGKKQPKAVESIKALSDMLSVNPVDFLRAKPADRVKALLESLPLEVDPARLAEVSGVAVGDLPKGMHAMLAIDAVHKTVYDMRTGANRAIKEKEGSIAQFSQTVPDAPGGVDGDEDSLTSQLETARTARDAELERIRTKIDGIRKSTADTKQTMRDAAQAEIDKIKAKLAEDLTVVDAELARVEGLAQTQTDKTKDKFQAAAEPLNQALSAIRANRDVAAKRQQALDFIATMRDELSELIEEAEGHTEALARINAYKSELLADLPIPGLEVRDGEIFRDGIPLDRINTAGQVKIAVEIAKLRAGDLKVCVVDGIELLDSEAYEEFRQQIEASGLQLFVAKVGDTELTINP